MDECRPIKWSNKNDFKRNSDFGTRLEHTDLRHVRAQADLSEQVSLWQSCGSVLPRVLRSGRQGFCQRRFQR